MAMDPFSMRGAGWGYFVIDPKYSGPDFRRNQKPIPPSEITDLDKFYALNGCEENAMFKPGTEPEGFKFFWFDNTMIPWLRRKSPANKIGHKLWQRVTYCRWAMTPNSPVDNYHRRRVNKKLREESNGAIEDISDLWDGIRATKVTGKKKALVVPSSEKNHRNYYNQTVKQWTNDIVAKLDQMGYHSVVRTKVPLGARENNEVSDQYIKGNFDIIVGQQTAAVCEVVVLGAPVIVTTENNPAYDVSTPWNEFCKYGIREYTEKQIDDWLTRMCGYTYYRDEIDQLKFIDVHPDGDLVRKVKNND